ncbi:MAG: VOC family protein [Myxococcales bacterium]|nr:VOC family protein [Myxococcales bacterium]
MECSYVHTNVVARDWRRLARFYEAVFGCSPVPPARDLSGEWLARGTGVPGAHLRGVHLRLPGSTATLEIFEYSDAPDRPPPPAHERGWGHIAFAVSDVEEALALVLEHGGARLGELVEREVPGAGTVCFVYARDPEGNVIELQRWA